MDDLESMFLLELNVEKLTTFLFRKLFHIEIHFSDIFHINIKDPNKDKTIPKSRRCKKGKNKNGNKEAKLQTVKSVLIKNNINLLIDHMRKYPMELSLWTKSLPRYRVGSTHIPWNWGCVDYLKKIQNNNTPSPISVEGEYNIFDECTSKRMGVTHLKLKLSYVSPDQIADIQSQSSRSYLSLYSELTCMPTKPKSSIDLTLEPGIIKTIYHGTNKHNTKRRNKRKLYTPYEDKADLNIALKETAQPSSVNTVNQLNSSLFSMIKSETTINNNNEISIFKSKSCSTICKDNVNILNYVFNDSTGQFGNQVYCVGYFTVENKTDRSTPSEKSSVPSDKSDASQKSKATTDATKTPEPMEKFKFKICDGAIPCSDSLCSISIQDAAAPLITVKKCEDVRCEHKKPRDLPPPDDDRILIDLAHLKDSCCKFEKIEEVVMGMKAELKIDDNTVDQCYCECECKFGFMKRTTYCKICGGYESAGEDLARRLTQEMPYPCPIYHKLLDKKPKPAPPPVAKSKCIEFEKKGKKGRAALKDERFKFNYGYTAPQIGHSNCTSACSGTISNVPKKMGWLWTSDNVPGLKEINQGWKPGAISKRLLSKLNKAKRQTAQVEKVQSTKKIKKRVEDKPTLIICKSMGEYRVEMQVSPKTSDINISYKPVIYKIASEDNEERVQRHARKRQRVIQRALENVRKDFKMYDEDICNKTCLQAYKMATGQLEYDILEKLYSNREPSVVEEEECPCESEETSSSGSSMNLEWEIHFTPPMKSVS